MGPKQAAAEVRVTVDRDARGPGPPHGEGYVVRWHPIVVDEDEGIRIEGQSDGVPAPQERVGVRSGRELGQGHRAQRLNVAVGLGAQQAGQAPLHGGRVRLAV